MQELKIRATLYFFGLMRSQSKDAKIVTVDLTIRIFAAFYATSEPLTVKFKLKRLQNLPTLGQLRTFLLMSY